MKKAYVFFTAIFVVVAIYVLAQDAQKSFLIKKEKSIRDGKTYLTTYLDPASNENYPSPKAGKGQYLELIGIEVNSIEKLKQIELNILERIVVSLHSSFRLRVKL